MVFPEVGFVWCKVPPCQYSKELFKSIIKSHHWFPVFPIVLALSSYYGLCASKIHRTVGNWFECTIGFCRVMRIFVECIGFIVISYLIFRSLLGCSSICSVLVSQRGAAVLGIDTMVIVIFLFFPFPLLIVLLCSWIHLLIYVNVLK